MNLGLLMGTKDQKDVSSSKTMQTELSESLLRFQMERHTENFQILGTFAIIAIWQTKIPDGSAKDHGITIASKNNMHWA